MIRAIKLTVDNLWEVVQLNEYSLEDYQKHLNGYIESVNLGDELTMYVNEEGKLTGMKTNLLASAVFAYHHPYSKDFIVGPALIVGPCDEDGFDTSVRADAELRLSDLLDGIAIKKEETNA